MVWTFWSDDMVESNLLGIVQAVEDGLGTRWEIPERKTIEKSAMVNHLAWERYKRCLQQCCVAGGAQ